MEARARSRRTSLEGKFASRAKEEADNIRAILVELERSIQGELNEVDTPQWRQQLLFTDRKELELLQLQNNVDALRSRLSDIPAEMERETEAIQARFADRKEHLFPVAVTWLVPQRLAGI